MKLRLILTTAATATAAAIQLSAAEVDWSKLPPAATQTDVTYDKEIAPIFKASCVRCHGTDRPRAQLRLDSLEGVLKGSKDGAVVKPGDSADSLLVKAISQLDPRTAMPPKPRPRGPRPMGTNAPAMQMPPGGPEAGGPPPGGPGNPPGTNGGATMQPHLRPLGAAKPLTAEQVGLVRAWIDQGAK